MKKLFGNPTGEALEVAKQRNLFIKGFDDRIIYPFFFYIRNML